MKVKDIEPNGTLTEGIFNGEYHKKVKQTYVYDGKTMQEYAKEKVIEAYKNIHDYAAFAEVNNMEQILPDVENVLKDIFEEDTI